MKEHADKSTICVMQQILNCYVKRFCMPSLTSLCQMMEDLRKDNPNRMPAEARAIMQQMGINEADIDAMDKD